MKIKTKLNLSVGLLFVLILILTAVSSYFIYTINKDTGNILTANYNTLEYSRNMLLSIDKIATNDAKSISFFETNLKKQLNNITEKGEAQATKNVQNSFELLKQNGDATNLKISIRKAIYEIMILNMDAIKRKSLVAEKTAQTEIGRAHV